MDSFSEPHDSRKGCLRRALSRLQAKPRCWLTPYRALALSHLVFIVLLVVMLTAHWWRGSVTEAVNCSAFEAHICLISECINGVYHGLVGADAVPRIFAQSVIWVCMSALPAFSALWLIASSKPRSCWDILVSIASCLFLIIGLVPDVLPGKWMIVHLIVAGLGILSGVLGIFSLSWCMRGVAILCYTAWYLLICAWLVATGTESAQVFDWGNLGHMPVVNGTLTFAILEWVGVLGACTVCVLYCWQQDRKSRARTSVFEQAVDSAFSKRALVSIV